MTQSSAAIAGGSFDATRDINFTGQTDFTNVTLSTLTSKIGFAVGSGAIVTQITTKATGVTINAPAGQITMNNAALAGAAEATFTVTNNQCRSGDVPLVCHGSAGTSGSYAVQASNVTNGAFDITVSNWSGGSLSEAIVINFVIFKGAST